MTDRFLIGYARVSTEDQDLRLQIAALTKYGVPPQQIIEEKASGGRMDRKGLRGILHALRKGDRVVVWKLDRLGRSLKGVIETIEKIEAAGADLVSLTESIDTTSAMGRFFFHIIAAMAELERGMISERTKAGVESARLANPDRDWGRKNYITKYPKRMKHLQKLYDAGDFELVHREKGGVKLSSKMTAKELAAELNKADPSAPAITNPETVRRWVRDGCEDLKR